MKYNKDIEFLKERFDNSGVNAPEEINREYVENIISEKPQNKIKLTKTKKRAIATVAAACVALVATAGILGGQLPMFRQTPVQQPSAPIASDTQALTAK